MRSRNLATIGLAGWLFADLFLFLAIIGQSEQPPPPEALPAITTTTTTTTTGVPVPTTEARGLALPVSFRVPVPASWTAEEADGEAQLAVYRAVQLNMQKLDLLGYKTGVVQIFGTGDSEALADEVAKAMRRWFPDELQTADIRGFRGTYENQTVNIEFFTVQ